jgi:hypothetical protein
MKYLIMEEGGEVTALDVCAVDSGTQYTFFVECNKERRLFGISGVVVFGETGEIVTGRVVPWIKPDKPGVIEIISGFSRTESNVVRPDFRRAAAG